jgi:hypothetical protein
LFLNNIIYARCSITASVRDSRFLIAVRAGIQAVVRRDDVGVLLAGSQERITAAVAPVS